ncbi:MAG: HepT-like ribonuclease domain-containing protein [Candidatus Micrarchaeota archaeon]
MLDKEQVSIMIKDIEKYLFDLSEMRVSSKDDLSEREKYYAVSMVIFSVMNRAIDIGNEILSSSAGLSLPGTYKETFDILAKSKAISGETAAKMNKLVKYRNIIAHEYYTLSIDEMWKIKNGLSNVTLFIDEVKKYVMRFR